LHGKCNCGDEHNPAPVNGTNGKPRSGKPKSRGKSNEPTGTLTDQYDYTDEHGSPRHATRRWKDPKDFRQGRIDEHGTYKPGLAGVRTYLYRLPELLEANPDHPVWICEGEKDCDRLRRDGLTATTCPMGAEKWRDHYSEWLAGRTCYALEDNDDKGRKHCPMVARSLSGKAREVKIIRLPDLPEHGDVSDWLDQGHTVDELLKIAESAPAFAPEETAEQTGEPKPDNAFRELSDDDLGIIRLSEVQECPVDWLWKYRLASGEIALIAGEGGLGKSQVLLALAATVSTGGEWPEPGTGNAPQGSVIILSAEDDPATTIKPRLKALGADLERVNILKASVVIRRPGKENQVSPISLQSLEYWRAVLDRVPDCRMLIIDPLPSYLGRGVNDSKNNEIREIIEPFLKQIVRPRRICMVCNSHLNKTVDHKTPIHRVNGSVAYGNIPRNVHFVVRDPNDPERRFFKQAKCNLAPDNLPALAFRIESTVVESANGPIETAIPVFERDTVDVDLYHCLNGEKGQRGRPTAKYSMALAEWLHDFLNGKGEVQASRIFDAAAAAFANECPNPLGEKKSNGKWTNGTALYRAADVVENLLPPRHGRKILKTRDEQTKLYYWQLIGADSAY
jgi:hypothetical protein